MTRGQVIDRHVIERHGLGTLRCIREIQLTELVIETDQTDSFFLFLSLSTQIPR